MDKTKNQSILDCAIIGAGPAGLTAGIYLKRFRRDIILVADNQSRASLIPISHNYPGFPQGISGNKLLENMREQLKKYKGKIVEDKAVAIHKNDTSFFTVHTEQFKFHTKNIIMATGVVDIEPKLPNLVNAIKSGLIRHCAVCDAYELIDQKIGIIGFGKDGMKEALFLQTYSTDITLFTLGEKIGLTKDELHQLQLRNIKIVLDVVTEVTTIKNKITAIKTKAGKSYAFDTLYSALGAKVNSDLAVKIGAEHDDKSCLIVDYNQQTNITGLYAAGDIVAGLNQICVATGQAAIAATAIHSSL